MYIVTVFQTCNGTVDGAVNTVHNGIRSSIMAHSTISHHRPPLITPTPKLSKLGPLSLHVVRLVDHRPTNLTSRPSTLPSTPSSPDL